MVRNTRGRAYATAWVPAVGGRMQFWMHKLVMNTASVVDHIDNDPMNNQRGNLRISDDSQNQWNKGKPTRRDGKSWTSPYKGVFYWEGRWIARIMAKRKKYSLGSYATEEDAARAYDDKARELHGEFARLNFP